MTQGDIKKLIASLKSSDQNTNDISAEDLSELLKLNPEGPYHFINLLKYKDVADYPADHPMAGKELGGRDAYNLYGAIAFQQVTMRGGRLMQSNKVELSMGGGDWDSVATMEYQNISAFFEMLADADYQTSLVHREAGLEATVIMVTRPNIQIPLGLKP